MVIRTYETHNPFYLLFSLLAGCATDSTRQGMQKEMVNRVTISRFLQRLGLSNKKA
jgi:hypothetical protein